MPRVVQTSISRYLLASRIWYVLICVYLQMATCPIERYELTEQQFANLIGRCRMHKYLPENQAKQVPELLFGDGQINAVCKDYYNDQEFCTRSGNINLWNLYNLFTGANKSTYIDNFLDRSVNAYQLTRSLQDALDNREISWFLN